MMELTLAILNRMSFVALTALLQSILILGLGCLVAKLVRRRYAVCHAICFGAILSCLICPVLAYGVISVGFVSPWSYRIADAESIDSDSASRSRIVADNSLDDIDPGSISEPRSSKTDPSLAPDAQNAQSEELASAVATPLAESKNGSDVEIRPLTSELSHLTPQSADAVLEKKASTSAASSSPDRVAELAFTAPKEAILLAAARWFVVGWCLLVVMFGSRMLFRSLRLKRLLADARVVENPEVLRLAKSISERTGLRRIPSVVVSSRIAVPFVYGMSSSKIAIPEFLLHPSCVEQLRDVLAHEMCHLRRGDLWMSFLQRMVQLVYCVNPFVHVIAARMTGFEKRSATTMCCSLHLRLDIAELCCRWPNVFRGAIWPVIRCMCCR